MMICQRWRGILHSAILTGFMIISAPGQTTSVRIGTVLDGPISPDAEMSIDVQREIVSLLSGRFAVEFPQDKQIVGDWTPNRVRMAVDSLLADPEVDVVLVFGVFGPAYVARRGELSKPVLAAVILDPEVQGVPIEIREQPIPGREGRERVRVSGVPNLSYLAYNRDLLRQVQTFREIAFFSRVTILTLQPLDEEIGELRSNLIRKFETLDVEVTVVPVGESVATALAEIPSDTEAVLVDFLPHLTNAEFEQLVQGLISRRLPSFSLVGQSDVRRGVMAGLQLERDDLRLVRRVALNLLAILLGEEAQELPVDFDLDEQLTINMATASAVGVDPTFILLTEAELIDEPTIPSARRLSLARAVQEASNVSLDLLAAERRVAAGLQLVKEARSSLLPQASVAGTGIFIDKDRATSFQGQRQVSGSVGASQLLYSERNKSGYDIEREQQIFRQEGRFQLRLDVIFEAAQSYLNVLRAKTIERIRRSNLRLTRSNLNLAQERVDIGSAGRDEALRWLSQIAVDRRSVIDSSAQRYQAEIAVNRVLNRPLEERFETVEAGLDDPELTTSFERLRPYIQSPGSFQVFREFMTEEAYEASPELKQLDAAVRAQERVVLATKRAFYVPTFGVEAELAFVKNGGEPSPLPPGAPNGVDWTVAVQATLPIFQGGALRAQRTRAQIELDQLTIERDATSLLIGERIRSQLYRASASFAGIQLAQEAASAALENLGIIRDAYSEGAVDILKLLDAQNQALIAELDAANAVFDHLIDLMAVQRAVGRFDYFRSPQERDSFLRNLDAFFQNAGYSVKKQ